MTKTTPTTAEQRANEVFEQMARQMANAASSVKLVTGVANNAAVLVMLYAHDKIKQHPRYKHKVKQAFRQALKTREDYERQLLHTQTNRFFHVDDMIPSSRKVYGADFTDQQYFEFWQSLGGPIYNKSWPFITSLWNKYRLSLINHHIEHPELLAWPMVAMSCLELARKLYQRVLDEAIEEYKFSRRLVERTFKDFDIDPVVKAWHKALSLLENTSYQLEPTEDKNIEMGLLQILDIWANPENFYDSTMEVIPAYDDIFRTKGEMKKALRNISEVREAVVEEMNK